MVFLVDKEGGYTRSWNYYMWQDENEKRYDRSYRLYDSGPHGWWLAQETGVERAFWTGEVKTIIPRWLYTLLTV